MLNKMKKKEIIEQRKQFPRMLVSDDNKIWNNRIVLFENINGSCISVDGNWEKEFLDGENVYISNWEYYILFPEKKQVPFKHGREIDWDWVFRNKANNSLFEIHSITESGLYLKNMSNPYCSFDDLSLYFELSKDGGKTWGYAVILSN